MELKCVRVWLILMLMFISSKRLRVKGCLKQEKSALLQLKHFFNNPYSIQDWVEGDKDSSDCCQWKGIECNNTTGRVTSLYLDYARNQEFEEWNLNVSLFSPFQELEILYLSDNLIVGCVDNEGFERLSHLSNLKTLYLNYNMFNDSRILSALSEHSSLKNLSLAYNHLRELNHFNVSQLTNLKYFSLSGNTFNHNILPYVSVFPSLKELHIVNIGLKGTFDFQDFPTFKNLKFLYIYHTHLGMFNGSFLKQGICKSLHLQKLVIVDSDLGGNLSWCLTNLTSLELVDISSNQFTRDISLSPLKVLTSIRDLWLSDNQFQIPFSLEPFFNHSKLKIFHSENNEIYVGSQSQYLAPKFQLNFIKLSTHNGPFSKMVGDFFPKFLYSQHDLEEVDLSNLNLKGNFPIWLLNNNTNLKKLYLVNNSLSGPLQLPIHSHIFLKELDIFINSFHGHIPTRSGAYLPMLQTLNISRNFLNGSIPSSFGDMKSLESLDLSYNSLIGQIPYQMVMGCFSLQFLVLSNNSLQGEIFPTTFNLKNLLKLQLDGNNFTGKIPNSLSNCSLEWLYISDNRLVGTLPRWLGNMPNLRDIIMSNNHLEGLIPLEFCQLENLEVLDLSKNNIIGSLPSCFPPSSIKQVHLSRNKL
ncbi:receptor-like protein 15 [Mangifera indica]|uniref:receptor-like protein 15 n=1 Tax=Mangifera indica TaxID=29780 RepID=UPI001CF9ED05|nr:receptor-like protein 15 [Mangifera indica]